MNPKFTQFDRLVIAGLLFLWAIIYLPNLRTNPNWYGDEGIVMEEAATLAMGTPRYGPMEMNFLSPNPHPPLYLMALALPIKLFGHDILVGRFLQTLVGLGTAAAAFWVGSLLLGRRFGFLCAAILLTYPEAALHYRWARGHPMQGLFGLICVGFLIRYIKSPGWKNIALAGTMATLAMGVHFLAFPLAGIVVVTAFLVRKRDTPVALASSLAFPVLFAAWLLVSQPGGLAGILSQMGAASEQGFKTTHFSPSGEFWRIFRLATEFVFLTPTAAPDGTTGTDLWITGGFLGLLFFPEPRFRKWLIFFAGSMMFGIFVARDNPLLFIYRTFAFLPLFAIGLSGGLVAIGKWLALKYPPRAAVLRLLPAGIVLLFCAPISVAGSLGHMKSKIDPWTVLSWKDAEQAMAYVNANTGPDDFVVMPDQLYWLYRWTKKAQLLHCAVFDFDIRENLAIGFPKSKYWFDPSLANAKYVVVAASAAPDGTPRGIDAVFWSGYEGVRRVLAKLENENWPVVFQAGEYVVLENPRLSK